MPDQEGRRWLWPVVGALVLCVAATFVWRAEANRRTEAWRVLRARAAIMATELPRGMLPHAPLLGPTVPGEACEAYARADELLAKAVSASPALKGFLALAWELDLPPNATEMLPLLEPTLAALAAGTACATIDYGAMWSRLQDGVRLGFDKGALLGTHHVGAAVSLAIRTESANGNHAAVIEATAHWLTLARDQWNFGVAVYDLVSTSIVQNICEFWTDSRLQALPSESKRPLAEVLARFDAQCALLSKSPEGDFLWRLQLADDTTLPNRPTLGHLELWLAAIDALQASRESGWTPREQALERVMASLDELRAQHLIDVERHRRQGLTNLRLLRLAVAHHLGEVLPTLRDPLGDGDLSVVEREDGIVLRSHGSIEGKSVERFVPRR